jgi:hypothetical protein
MCLNTKRTASRTLKKEVSLIPVVKFEDDTMIQELQCPFNSVKHRSLITVVVSGILIIMLLCYNGAASLGANGTRVVTSEPAMFSEKTLLPTPIEPHFDITTHAPFLVPLHSSLLGNSDVEKMWSEVVLKPLLLEVGLMIIFQSASVPIAKLLIHKGYRHRGWRRFLTQHFWWRRKALTPRVILQRILHSIRRLYKMRSRLSAASDMTHVLGDEE